MEEEKNQQQPERKRRRLYETVEENNTKTTNEEKAQPREKKIEVNTESERADEIINNYMHWSMGMDFMPLKAFDNIGLTNLQIKLVVELADLYNVYYSEISGKALILSLLGDLRGKNRPKGLLGILAKNVPGGEMVTGIINKPKHAGASSYAVGQTFKLHFEKGGSLVAFDAAEYFEDFQAAFAEGLQKTSKFID